MMHIIALIMEYGAPYRVGFDNWYRQLATRFPLQQQRDNPTPPTYFDYRDTALENAGGARALLTSFLGKYIELETPFGYRELAHWLGWADGKGCSRRCFPRSPDRRIYSRRKTRVSNRQSVALPSLTSNVIAVLPLRSKRWGDPFSSLPIMATVTGPPQRIVPWPAFRPARRSAFVFCRQRSDR